VNCQCREVNRFWCFLDGRINLVIFWAVMLKLRFLSRASDPPNQWNGRTAKYPGNYYVKETGKLVARVRMFIGRCIDSREGVAWFIENFEGEKSKIERF